MSSIRSISSVIEIKHDSLDALVEHGYIGPRLVKLLREGYGNYPGEFFGAKVLIQRHHAEEVTIKIT